MFVFLVCLVLAALSVDAGVVLGLPTLYNNYHGEYAASYDNYEPRPYAFEYGVSDPHTGDHKTQWETKDKAGVVRGSYSLLEPDGSTRIVDYIADDHGFRAVVKKIGIYGQSVESHGGAVEESSLAQPIVVPDIEPVPILLEEPVHVPQPLSIQQPLPVQQSQRLVDVQQAPIFQSYDGGIEHYQNLLQHQQPYTLQYPQAEGVYVETPKHDFGNYAPYVPQQELPQSNYVQQVPSITSQQVYSPEPIAAPIPAAPNGEVYYTQVTEVGNPQGKSVVAFHQPQIALQENHITPVAAEHNGVYNQIQQRPVAHNESPIGQYGSQLTQENYPNGNHVLVQNPGYIAEHELQLSSGSSQGVQGITGNLADDSAYTNYARSGNAPLVLNKGEYLPQPSQYGQVW